MARSAPRRRPPARCADCALRRHEGFADVCAADLAAINSTRKGTRLYGRGSPLFLPGDPPDEIFTLYSGWAFSYRMLADGRRQILTVHLPGDTVGVQPDASMPLTHGVETLTRVSACVFDHAGLEALIGAHGGLAWQRCWALTQERSLLQERLASVGRHAAAERLAFLCLELYARAEQVGLARDGACPLPLNQTQLGDALGLSDVHVSRMAVELRGRGLLHIADGSLALLDRTGLEAMCGFQGRFQARLPLL